MKKTLISLIGIITVLIFLNSCARGITNYEAANGKARCGRFLR